MSAKSKIEWTDATWNPVRGCSRISPGCVNCYAERQAARFSDPGQYAHGFVKRTPSGPRWTGKLELVPDKLRAPLSWTRPRRVFVNSMSDLFHEKLDDDAIDRVFAVMAFANRHTFQVLTKRADRMRDYLKWRSRSAAPWKAAARELGFALEFEGLSLVPFPLPNVWLGVSVENQDALDSRWPALANTPAAVRFLSVEPMLEPTDLCLEHYPPGIRADWVIVGGESGPGARACYVDGIRSVVAQCREAGVAVFVKQVGARPTCSVDELDRWPFSSRGLFEDRRTGDDYEGIMLRDRKGGDPDEWPADLRVREFPQGLTSTPAGSTLGGKARRSNP